MGRPFGTEAAMGKLFNSDLAMETTEKCLQFFGGYGYTKEYSIERMMRDAKITQIYEGTNEIQKMVIGWAQSYSSSIRFILPIDLCPNSFQSFLRCPLNNILILNYAGIKPLTMLVFNWLMPVMVIVLAFFGVTVARINNEAGTAVD